MATSKRKTEKVTGAIIFLLVLLSVCMSVLGYRFYVANKEMDETIADNQEIYEALLTEESSNKETLEELENKVELLNSIDERIETIKEEYFDNALEVDRRARNGEADYKVCYLTFDDGPYTYSTNDFLDVLEEYDVQATFFVIERDGQEYIDILKREKMNCHTIGNHSDTHLISRKYKNSIYRSEEAFIESIINNRNYVEEAIGYTSEVVRFPGGSYQSIYMGLSRDSIAAKLTELHYGYVDWNLTTGDGGGVLPADVFLHNVIDYSEKFDAMVVLMHDYSANTLACLPEMIETLSSQGFIFLPLFYECPSVKKG